MISSIKKYSTLFHHLRAKLLNALGAMTSGGIVEDIQPIGSNSVPDLAGPGCLDIGLSVWPFPVDEAKLASAGYHPVNDAETAQAFPTLQRFEDASGQVQVWLSSTFSGFLENAVLIRDYLAHSEPARQDFLAHPGEKAAFFERALTDAQRWWVEQNGFKPLETIAAEFEGSADFPWYIASGWAIDLFLGRVTRVHRDVDVVVPFSHQTMLQTHLLKRGWQLYAALDGHLEPWPRFMQLQLPRHQIHAHRDGAFIDVLLTEIEHGAWRYRRDPAILRNADLMGLKSPSGIPYLAPELVLLFKSRNTSNGERPQDQADFEQVLPLLEPERRAWLRWAITANDPEHEWLQVL